MVRVRKATRIRILFVMDNPPLGRKISQMSRDCLDGKNFRRMQDINDNKREEKIQVLPKRESLKRNLILKLVEAGKEKSSPETEADRNPGGEGKSYGISVCMVMKRTGIFGKRMMDISDQEKGKERDKDNSFHAFFCLGSMEPG